MAPVLEMSCVTVKGDKGLNALSGLDLTVYAGEIFGIAGVAGNGQRELAEVIAGMRKPLAGSISIAGKDISRLSVRELARSDVSYIPEDRMSVGLVAPMDIPENTSLRHYESGKYNNRGVLRQKDIRRKAKELVDRHNIRNAGLHVPVSLMSGGNLQKLLVARETNGEHKLIVAAYPVHGVDVGATEAIHKILLEQRDNGAAILLISEDLEELYELSDRVGVLYEGRIMDTVDITEFTYDGIGRLMMGLGSDENAAGGDAQ